jgi:hypothetical protein
MPIKRPYRHEGASTEPEPVRTIAEAMAMLRCCGTIRNLRKAGKLRAINIGVGQRRGGPRILLADILKLAEPPKETAFEAMQWAQQGRK